MECNDHILLIGFMGSGKTSTSRRLSSMTGLSLIDLDYRIECIEHRTIPEIFEAEGEAGFRRIETGVLQGLGNESRSIVSCGGGTAVNEVNRPILKKLGAIVYLRIGLEEAIGRISRPESRPMLHGARPVEDIYNERLPVYEELADIVVDVDGLSVYQVARRCADELEQRGLL